MSELRDPCECDLLKFCAGIPNDIENCRKLSLIVGRCDPRILPTGVGVEELVGEVDLLPGIENFLVRLESYLVQKCLSLNELSRASFDTESLQVIGLECSTATCPPTDRRVDECRVARPDKNSFHGSRQTLLEAKIDRYAGWWMARHSGSSERLVGANTSIVHELLVACRAVK